MRGFDPATLLAGTGQRVVSLEAKSAFFRQGTAADCIFYLQHGRARLSVVSEGGKEATICMLTAGDLLGEEALTSAEGVRTATAIAVTACTALRVEREEMNRLLHEDTALSAWFVQYLLTRGLRTQADLVDQLFNSSERRLARTLLLMANFGSHGEADTLIPPITQEALAEMIGTTRSRVSLFMNRFRKLGFITYNGRIRVYRTLLTYVLRGEDRSE
jgi:CRP-like cAMP-binding protein